MNGTGVLPSSSLPSPTARSFPPSASNNFNHSLPSPQSYRIPKQGQQLRVKELKQVYGVLVKPNKTSPKKNKKQMALPLVIKSPQSAPITVHRLVDVGGEISLCLGLILCELPEAAGDGVMVRGVEKNSYAMHSGFLVEDVVQTLNDVDVLSARQFEQALEKVPPEQTVVIARVRRRKPFSGVGGTVQSHIYDSDFVRLTLQLFPREQPLKPKTNTMSPRTFPLIIVCPQKQTKADTVEKRRVMLDKDRDKKAREKVLRNQMKMNRMRAHNSDLTPQEQLRDVVGSDFAGKNNDQELAHRERLIKKKELFLQDLEKQLPQLLVERSMQIAEAERKLKEKHNQKRSIAEKEKQLAEKENAFREKALLNKANAGKAEVLEKERQLAEMAAMEKAAEKEKQLAELAAKEKEKLAEQERMIAEKEKQLAEKEKALLQKEVLLMKETAGAETHTAEKAQIAEKERQLTELAAKEKETAEKLAAKEKETAEKLAEKLAETEKMLAEKESEISVLQEKENSRLAGAKGADEENKRLVGEAAFLLGESAKEKEATADKLAKTERMLAEKQKELAALLEKENSRLAGAKGTDEEKQRLVEEREKELDRREKELAEKAKMIAFGITDKIVQDCIACLEHFKVVQPTDDAAKQLALQLLMVTCVVGDITECFVLWQNEQHRELGPGDAPLLATILKETLNLKITGEKGLDLIIQYNPFTTEVEITMTEVLNILDEVNRDLTLLADVLSRFGELQQYFSSVLELITAMKLLINDANQDDPSPEEERVLAVMDAYLDQQGIQELEMTQEELAALCRLIPGDDDHQRLAKWLSEAPVVLKNAAEIVAYALEQVGKLNIDAPAPGT